MAEENQQEKEQVNQAPKGIKVVKQPGQVAEGNSAAPDETQGPRAMDSGNTNCVC